MTIFRFQIPPPDYHTVTKATTAALSIQVTSKTNSVPIQGPILTQPWQFPLPKQSPRIDVQAAKHVAALDEQSAAGHLRRGAVAVARQIRAGASP